MIKGKKSVTKILTAIITALTVIIGVLAVAIIINMVVCRIQNKPVSFFGISLGVVPTSSMEPTIMTGDLIVYRTCNYSDIKEGDIIVFIAGKSFPEFIQGQNVVHRVKEVTEKGLVTKGDNNDGQDGDLVTEDTLRGLCIGHSAFWGAIFRAFSQYGIFIIIAIIAIPFIVGQIVKVVKLSKQKNKQTDEKSIETTDIAVEEEQTLSKVETDESNTDNGSK